MIHRLSQPSKQRAATVKQIRGCDSKFRLTIEESCTQGMKLNLPFEPELVSLYLSGSKRGILAQKM